MAHLHPARLPAAAGVHLGFDHPRRSTDLGAPVGGLLGTVRQTTTWDGHVKAGQDLLGLVLVNVHTRPPFQARPAPAALIASSIAITVWAIRSEAASIILPSTDAAPLPCASACRSASMIRRARSTSA